MRKVRILLALALALACVLVQVSGQQTDNDTPTGGRANFKLPKVFDFTKFKEIFTKRYATLQEELVRGKIFMGRTLKMFVSAVSYMHRQSSSYLATNQMSDWTNQELAGMYKSASHPVAALSESPEENPVADEQSIKQELVKLESSHQPLAGQILDQLRPRRRRDTLQPDRQLSMDELVRRPKDGQLSSGSTKLASRPPKSNNPNYRPPELTSYASMESPFEPQLGSWMGAMLERLQPAPFIRSVLDSALTKSMFGDRLGSKIYHAGAMSSNDSLIMYLDHRDTSCFLKPRNQGRCGSCYAFAAISLFEWIYCMDTGQLVAFSEQFIVDCGSRIGMDGCEGGAIDEAVEFIHRFGLELARSYPYSGVQDVCPTLRPENMGYLLPLKPSAHDVPVGKINEALEFTPLLVSMRLNLDFPFYGGGVDELVGCHEEYSHAMLLIGQGQLEGQPFYLLRNSHGPSWGHEGYWLLSEPAMARCINDGLALMSSATFSPKPAG